jgi:hypothetical protein
MRSPLRCRPNGAKLNTYARSQVYRYRLDSDIGRLFEALPGPEPDLRTVFAFNRAALPDHKSRHGGASEQAYCAFDMRPSLRALITFLGACHMTPLGVTARGPR